MIFDCNPGSALGRHSCPLTAGNNAGIGPTSLGTWLSSMPRKYVSQAWFVIEKKGEGFVGCYLVAHCETLKENVDS
jgi:hypothetical protein